MSDHYINLVIYICMYVCVDVCVSYSVKGIVAICLMYANW
jgi:hypothetical protein